MCVCVRARTCACTVGKILCDIIVFVVAVTQPESLATTYVENIKNALDYLKENVSSLHRQKYIKGEGLTSWLKVLYCVLIWQT